MAKKDAANPKAVKAQTDSEVINDELIEEEFPLQIEQESQPFHVGDFILKYRHVLGGAVIVLLLAFAGYLFYRENLKEQNQEALEQMSQAVQFFEQDSIRKAIVGTSQFPGFETLVDEYGNTDAGNLCKYYLGVCYLKQGKIAEGLEMLKRFSQGDNLVSAAACAAMAYAYEEQKEFEEAAGQYLRAAETKRNDQTTPYYLLQAGRVLEYAEKNERALEQYKRIKKEYPLSEEARNIDRLIARLED